MIIDVGTLILAGIMTALWNALEKSIVTGFFSVVYPLALLATMALMILPLLAVEMMIESGHWSSDWAAVALIWIGLSLLVPFLATAVGNWGQMIAYRLAGAAGSNGVLVYARPEE